MEVVESLKCRFYCRVHRTKCGICFSDLTDTTTTTTTTTTMRVVGTVFPPPARPGRDADVFKYGAHIMYCEQMFTTPGTITKVRNGFSGGRPASRDADVF